MTAMLAFPGLKAQRPFTVVPLGVSIAVYIAFCLAYGMGVI
jgi:hypothetical protein